MGLPFPSFAALTHAFAISRKFCNSSLVSNWSRYGSNERGLRIFENSLEGNSL